MKTTKRSILLVDDDPMIRDFLSFILEMNGFVVYKAGSAYEALPVLVDKGIDLCLSDIQMPRVDGFQLCARIRELCRDVKVILMTADYSTLVDRRARACGAVDCFSKDISPGYMVEKIRAQLEMAEAISDVA